MQLSHRMVYIRRIFLIPKVVVGESKIVVNMNKWLNK